MARFQKVLDQITQSFKSVYKSLTGKELTPELRKMFDEILGKETSPNPNSKGEGTGTTTEVKEPTITEANKAGQEAETATEEPPVVPPITPLTNTERSNEGELRDKGILASMHKSVPESAKAKIDE